MAHRDDRDAQRHRIDALERELEETRRRAEKAEKAAQQQARERSAPSPRPTREQRDEARLRRTSDAHWSPFERRRFTLGAALAVVCADVPVVGLFASGVWTPRGDDDSVLMYSLAPGLCVVPIVWLLATWTRAPFPSSALLSSILTTAMGWFAILAASTDMLWGEVLAEGPMRWFTRGSSGLLAIAVHALVLSVWGAEAAMSEVSSSD
jgi:hypothetical protein